MDNLLYATPKSLRQMQITIITLLFRHFPTMNTKAYQLSTCSFWNFQIHKYPAPQSKSLNRDLDQLNSLSYSQACVTQKEDYIAKFLKKALQN